MYARIQRAGFPNESIDVESWLAFRASCPRLASCEWRLFRDPVDGRFFVYEMPNSAEVVIEGEPFGLLMFERGALSVHGEPRVVTPVVFEVAGALRCEVVDEGGQPLKAPPSTDLVAVAKSLLGDRGNLPLVPVAVHHPLNFREMREAFDFVQLWRERDDVVEAHEEPVPHADLADIDVIHRYLTEDGGLVDVYVRSGKVIRVSHGWQKHAG